ncbi:hypothetical protein ACWDF1_30975 [Streptomyces coelicoflavus]|uniref:hypothetical protein n=1 Tax=Streptomyces TaxID=1883 RepID=UPI000B408C6D|nr:hypothetical protein [Streptomyces sp. CS159]OWA14818.1 hypothetical protein B9W64_16090 [Streptomyces sp. CS159]
MPTPYGPRGGMAFGAQELRVLRRALALALNPSPVSAREAQDCLHLAESLDEAMREGARLRAFLVADLARYRAALPGTATGYLALLDEALDAGHRPGADDLAALGALRGNPAAAALLARCGAATATTPVPAAATSTAATVTAATVTLPAARTRLHAVAGGRRPDGDPAQKPAPKPAPRPAPAAPKRPVPTPGEVFPRRKPAPPAPPAPDTRHHLAAG